MTSENTRPSRTARAPFPVVGIGASAGGLAAFEAFFSGMPRDADPGMAFVLVQHLAPDHKSLLTGLVQRYTRMQVLEVEDGMVVQPGCAYIIPPNHDMEFTDGALRLLAPSAPRGQRLPIDHFFRSLAQDQHERAIGVVLSGTGADGTLGVRAIKGEGGMVMAQTPASTEFDGMPRSALATGLVDFELPPAEMPAQLVAYVDRAFRLPPGSAPDPSPQAADAVARLFVLLRARTGHDFSQYKPSTLHRRIERRLAILQIDGLDRYVQLAEQTPSELEALFRDLLIGVTRFFRDPEVFARLEEDVLPRLLEDKPEGAALRVWSAGCSTGEEAYSLAILIQEQLERLRRRHPVQVFGTDLDGQAIAVARIGRYPGSIAQDVTAERLARFFTAEADGAAYRIHRGTRDLLVFSEQDLIQDPPFSRLDLVACRNLLIYLGADLQRRILPLFHYALRPGGFLLLGTSENIGDAGDRFTVVDRQSKIFQRRPDRPGGPVASLGAIRSGSLAGAAGTDRASLTGHGKAPLPGRLPLRDLTERALLGQVTPAAVLVTGDGDLLYQHGRTGRFLEPAPGEAGGSNVLAMAREGLRSVLPTALHRAVAEQEIIRYPGLQVRTNGDHALVHLAVHPVTVEPAVVDAPRLYLVVLEEARPFEPGPGSPPGPAPDPAIDADAHLATLREELLAKEEYLQTAHEELVTANEELRSANEELQSTNEEAQSTNEELETAKEELQSTNEELATINAELQTKVADLSQAMSDLSNLLASTGIGTLFVDHQLRIQRFTPATTRIINLIPSDVGRPVGHTVTNLVGYDRLVEDVQAVLDTLIPREVEVQTRESGWYRMRIQPYRTLDNVIEGAVITFVDVTEMKRTEAELREVQARLRGDPA